MRHEELPLTWFTVFVINQYLVACFWHAATAYIMWKPVALCRLYADAHSLGSIQLLIETFQ